MVCVAGGVEFNDEATLASLRAAAASQVEVLEAALEATAPLKMAVKGSWGTWNWLQHVVTARAPTGALASGGDRERGLGGGSAQLLQEAEKEVEQTLMARLRFFAKSSSFDASTCAMSQLQNF